MILKNFIVLILVVLTLSTQSFSQTPRSLPKFENYKIREEFTGKPAKIILNSKRARMYRTRILEGAKSGVNFAGHYTIIGWGAGLSAFSLAIVNAKTGKIYFPPFDYIDASLYGVPNLENSKNPDFRLDSSLLVFYGQKNGESPLGIYYYVFKKNHLSLVRFVKAKSE